VKTAVMYGAGNIGRGFIGTLFSASGYRTVFVDISDPVVEALNREKTYPVRILSDGSYEDLWVENVCAVDGKNPDAVAETIASADLMATAVGVNVLPRIVPNLVRGLRLRRERQGGPLNLLICENLMDANRVLGEMIKEHLDPSEYQWFEENLGLVETSIGRMVPVQTEEMKDGNPLRVCVERYGFLPVDRDAFRGEIPPVRQMIPFSPFDFYVKRKLYLHNMGHVVCAYLGGRSGMDYIAQAIEQEEIYLLVKGAMEESVRALSLQYGVALEDLWIHMEDLLFRFGNRALKDTCLRVGADPRRKLSPADRLVGAMNLACANGVIPSYIAVGAGAALVRYQAETGDETSPEEVLRELCGLDPEIIPGSLVLENYRLLVNGADLKDLRRRADVAKAALRKDVI